MATKTAPPQVGKSQRKKLNISKPQFKDLVKQLGLRPDITIGELLTCVELSQHEEAGSTYILVHYKSYEKNIDPYWKQFRGVIVKDYNRTVCISNGHTPNLTVTGALKDHITKDANGHKVLNLTETSEDNKTTNHAIPLRKGRFYVRPSFQGTIVRVWLSDGIVHRSSLRKFSILNAKWNRTDVEGEAKLTFSEKFDQLCRYGRKQLFAPGVKNSPFCHVFLMCTPQATTYSRINCGSGYVLYLETTVCYTPIQGDPAEEYESHFLQNIKTKNYPLSEEDIKAGYLMEEENAAGVVKYLDRYVYPLGKPDPNNYAAKFIPDPSTPEYIAQYSAVYRETISMTLTEADLFLLKGLDLDSSDKDLAKLQEKYPLFLPGESLYLTLIIKEKGSIRTQNYILTPPCVNYKTAMLGYLGNMQSQLVLLRRQAINRTKGKSGNLFLGLSTDLETASFDDLAQIRDGKKTPIKDDFYYGISNKDMVGAPPADSNYTLLKPPPEGILAYAAQDMEKLYKAGGPTERDSYASTRWYILAYHYCLCLPPARRVTGWITFGKMYHLYIETMNFLTDNYEYILNTASPLYTSRAFTSKMKQHTEGVERMRNIVETAMSAKYTQTTETQKDILPDFVSEGETKEPLVESKVAVTYAGSLKMSERETQPKAVVKNIRNLLRKEDPTSLYHMMKIVRNYNSEKASAAQGVGESPPVVIHFDEGGEESGVVPEPEEFV